VDAVHDVVVVGAGCAGMRAAIEAFDAGADVAMISKIHPVRSHSGAAEGGINAALGNASEDDPEKHAFDTVKGSDYLGDQDAIEIFTREAPQYGVDETGIARRLPVRLREPHRKIDGGVIRHIEKKYLGRSDEQRGLDARRLRRQAFLETEADEVAQRPQPAQRRCGERPDERTVAPRQFRKGRARGGGFELVVEGAAAAKHAVENVGGDTAGGETRHIVGGALRASHRVAASLHGVFFAWIESNEGEASTEDLRRRLARAK
jgi:glycine/D-amino acid oxidase-like deaminating enzyme